MQIILLDEARFDQFAISHPNHNYYQTSNYGRLMTKHGHNAYYLGLAADDGEIKAATLIIVKNDSKEKRKTSQKNKKQQKVKQQNTKHKIESKNSQRNIARR